MRTILLLFITFTSIAQNNFVGRVTDSSGEPIVGANILIEESNLITYTDEKGKFYLNSNSTNVSLGFNITSIIFFSVTKDIL